MSSEQENNSNKGQFEKQGDVEALNNRIKLVAAFAAALTDYGMPENEILSTAHFFAFAGEAILNEQQRRETDEMLDQLYPNWREVLKESVIVELRKIFEEGS